MPLDTHRSPLDLGQVSPLRATQCLQVENQIAIWIDPMHRLRDARDWRRCGNQTITDPTPLSPLASYWPLATCRLPLCVCLLLWLATGCRVVQSTGDFSAQTLRAVSPGRKDKPAMDPLQVQETLLRFADEFSEHVIVALEPLHLGTYVASSAEVLQWKIGIVTGVYSIASGPNAFVNLLDMTVLVTVMRTAAEERWQSGISGGTLQPLLESFRNAEDQIWRFASQVLNDEQQAELRGAIDVWRKQNPLPESVLGARAVGFAMQVAQAKQTDPARPGSVFNLLQLNPLSSLDPATRELAQTRLFAERALYMAQKLPMLLRWQVELLSVNLGQVPAVEQAVSNSTQIAASLDRFAAVAEKLPGRVSAERQAILKELEAQEQSLTSLIHEVRQTLTVGSQMSTSLNITLTTFDALMQRFGVGETNTSPGPDTADEPFRIRDYATTAAQLEATARQLTELLITLDQTIGSTNLLQLSAQVGPVVQQAQTRGKEVVDYAFRKGILLVVIVLLAALIYRLLVARLTASGPKSNSPDRDRRFAKITDVQ